MFQQLCAHAAVAPAAQVLVTGNPQVTQAVGTLNSSPPLPLFVPVLAALLAGPLCPSRVHIEDT